MTYPLVNGLPPGSPSDPAPPLVKSVELIARVAFEKGGYEAHTNPWGSVTDLTDAIGQTTQYERNEQDLITRATLPLGNCVEYTYNDKGKRISETQIVTSQCSLAPE